MAATAVIRSNSVLSIPSEDALDNVDRFGLPGDTTFPAVTNTMAQIIIDPDDAITGDPMVVEIELMQPGGTWTVVAATDLITTSADHLRAANDQVRFTNSGGALPTSTPAITAGTPYYVRDIGSSTTFKIAATPGGAVIDFTGTGTGTHSWQFYGGIELTYPYGAPAIPVQVKDRRDGTVNDFTKVRAVHVVAIPLDPAQNALGSGYVTCGDSADPDNYFSVPWSLDYTAADPLDEKARPSVLIALPDGFTYSNDDPFKVVVNDDLSNVNVRLVVSLLGN